MDSEGCIDEVTHSDTEDNAQIAHCNIRKAKWALAGPF